MKKSILFYFIMCITLAQFLGSCSKTEATENDAPHEEDAKTDFKPSDVTVIRDWGISLESVKKKMANHRLVKDTDDCLVFEITSGNWISYQFVTGKLSAASVVTKVESEELNKQWQNHYSYLGEVGEVSVFCNDAENTFAMKWKEGETEAVLRVIWGFIPIESDLLPEIPDITVTSGSIQNLGANQVHVEGTVSGVDSDVEVGFIYGQDPNLSEWNGRKVSTRSMGSYNLTLTQLMDETVYYYRAYAEVDEICYYGDIIRFETPTLEYTLNGATFKMIHITDGPVAPFAIMQTELPATVHMYINGNDLGCLRDDGVPATTKYNLCLMLGRLYEETGIVFRQCSEKEWLYAVKGGAPGQTYSGSNDLDAVGWYSLNSNGSAQGLALKQPNGYGIYDMSGNYGEIVMAHSSIDALENNNDPMPDFYECDIDGDIYGGSWKDTADKCRTTCYKKGDESAHTVPGTNLKEYNATGNLDATVRLAYSLDQPRLK